MCCCFPLHVHFRISPVKTWRANIVLPLLFLMLCTSSSLNLLSSSLLPSFPLSLPLPGSDSPLQGWGPAPPSDDIRGLEIAATLKLPVMGACCEACNPGQPLPAEREWEQQGQRDGRGWEKKKKSDREDNEVTVATSQMGSSAWHPSRANITRRGGAAKCESGNYVLSN